MNEVVIYIREWVDTPTCLIQQAECMSWIDQWSASLHSIIIEKCSKGTSLRERPKLLKLLMQLEKGQTILIYSREYLGLNDVALSLIEMEVYETACIVRSCLEPDLRRLISEENQTSFTHIVNAYRRQILGGKIKTSIQDRLADGYRAGNVKLGQQANDFGQVFENSEERTAINFVQNLRAKGYSVEKVQQELESLGITCRSGKVPSIPTISRWTYHDFDNKPSPKVRVKLEDKYPLLGEEIFKLRAKGMSYAKISGYLSSLGYRSRTGKPLMPTQLRRIYLRVVDTLQKTV